MIDGPTVFEVLRPVTLTRGSVHRISLLKGAMLRIDLQDHDFSDRELERAVAEGRLRPISPAIFR
jgi:hypothetical protein